MNLPDSNDRIQAMIAANSAECGDGLDAARGIAWALMLAGLLLAVVCGAVVAFVGVK